MEQSIITRRLLLRAMRIAATNNAKSVNCDHLLLSFINDSKNIGYHVLSRLALDLTGKKADLPDMASHNVITSMSANLSDAIEFAKDEMINAGGTVIGCEDLFLGMCRSDPGVFERLFDGQRISIEQIRSELAKLCANQFPRCDNEGYAKPDQPGEEGKLVNSFGLGSVVLADDIESLNDYIGALNATIIQKTQPEIDRVRYVPSGIRVQLIKIEDAFHYRVRLLDTESSSEVVYVLGTDFRAIGSFVS